MAFTTPDLPYPYDALEPYIDEQTMRIHHDKHHAGYVSKLNAAVEGTDYEKMDVVDLLKAFSSVEESLKPAVQKFGGGHANHALFWTVMGKNGGGEPTGELAQEINKTFGSFEEFKKQFATAATGRFGSGWAWLVVDGSGKLQITSTANQDSPYMDGLTPILGLDVWEHAYYLKYQNKRADYISEWWNVVDWDAVAKNYAQAR
ncbi:MAG: superoxide dismutase [Alkalispirochaetaceae bacterium]